MSSKRRPRVRPNVGASAAPTAVADPSSSDATMNSSAAPSSSAQAQNSQHNTASSAAPAASSARSSAAQAAQSQQQQQQQQQQSQQQSAENQAIVAAPQEGLERQKHRTGLEPRIVNIVATVNLGCKLDLKHIALHARNAEYTPKRFSAVIMRIREPHTTALVFGSGKVICTGAKNEDDSWRAARKYGRIIQKLGFEQVKFRDFAIQNMVGSIDVKFPIRLEGLAANHQCFCTYEPELFPGLIYRMVKPKLVILIFVSGKVVITGAKSRQDIRQAFDNIYTILLQFRKT